MNPCLLSLRISFLYLSLIVSSSSLFASAHFCSLIFIITICNSVLILTVFLVFWYIISSLLGYISLNYLLYLLPLSCPPLVSFIILLNIVRANPEISFEGKSATFTGEDIYKSLWLCSVGIYKVTWNCRQYTCSFTII